jgi:hypothetical protein
MHAKQRDLACNLLEGEKALWPGAILIDPSEKWHNAGGLNTLRENLRLASRDIIGTCLAPLSE